MDFLRFADGATVSDSLMSSKRARAALAPISVWVRQICNEIVAMEPFDVLCAAPTTPPRFKRCAFAQVERATICYEPSKPAASIPAILPNTKARSTDTAFGAVP